MHVFEAYERSKDALARIGESVRAEARATGTNVCYTEQGYGYDLITEYPDGRRERRRADGTVVDIPPRAA